MQKIYAKKKKKNSMIYNMLFVNLLILTLQIFCKRFQYSAH